MVIDRRKWLSILNNTRIYIKAFYIFVAKTHNYDIFVAKARNYAIFVAKIYDYALIDSFWGFPRILDSPTSYATLCPLRGGSRCIVTSVIEHNCSSSLCCIRYNVTRETSRPPVILNNSKKRPKKWKNKTIACIISALYNVERPDPLLS